jgi:predicted AAA+ superfamily ATPase
LQSIVGEVIITRMAGDSRFLPRLLAPSLEDRLRRFPVVVLTGARQAGKTTLAQHLDDASRHFVSLDSLAALDQARREPETLVHRAPRMTIDEVQRAPDLLLAVKEIVDRQRAKGQFLLTGSANLLLLRSVAESLAGRAVYLILRGLTEREKRRVEAGPVWPRLLVTRTPAEAAAALGPGSDFDWREAALVGGFPPVVTEGDATNRALWFDGYTETYLHRDVRDLAQVGDLAAFGRLLQLASLRVGGLLNQAALGRDAGVTQTTAQRWLSILEATFAIHLLPAFSESHAKRLIKAPKLFAGDTGLGLHLADVNNPEELSQRPAAGAWLENLVLNDLLAWAETEVRKPAVFFRRTVGGEEIDLIVEQGRRLLPIEIKASRVVRVDDARAVQSFCDEFGTRAPLGLVLYDGKEVRPLTRQTLAVPLRNALT